MLQWVIERARASAGYVSRPGLRNAIEVKVYILCPEGDRIADYFKKICPVIQGPEHDVLARYKKLLDFSGADHVVRITGDCPLIPEWIITRAIHIGVIDQVDYASNVDERMRLAWDGTDVEIMSARMLTLMDEKAFMKGDREHVTTYARREKLPDDFKSGFMTPGIDLSGLKLSVDTEDDLAAVRKQYERILDCTKKAKEYYGDGNVYRY